MGWTARPVPGSAGLAVHTVEAPRRCATSRVQRSVHRVQSLVCGSASIKGSAACPVELPVTGELVFKGEEGATAARNSVQLS